MEKIPYDAINSFLAFANTGNQKEAAKKAGVTRQTISRHIKLLQKIKNDDLFIKKPGSVYKLTKVGLTCLSEFKKLMDSASSILGDYRLTLENVKGLELIKYEDKKGNAFYSQQHTMHTLWQSELNIFKIGFKCWANASCEIGRPAFKDIEPYLMIYRNDENGWLCTHIGDQSSYITWFDRKWALSAIGRISQEDPAGYEFNKFIESSHSKIFNEGSLRFDHIYAQIPREQQGKPVPVAFQRLLLGCRYPDGTPALADLVFRTNKIEIGGFDFQNHAHMSAEYEMKDLERAIS